MDSEEDSYEFDIDFAVPSDKNRRSNDKTQRATTFSSSHSSSSDHEDQDRSPPSPILPLFKAMDIPSVRGPPVSCSDDAGRPSIRPTPSSRRVSLGSGEKGEISQY